MKERMNNIESEELNEYLKKRVIAIEPEEILFLSKELNLVLNE